jgi:hypothetical protein
MAIEIHKQFFETRKQVFDDLAESDLWPHTFITWASPTLPLHWHDADIVGYVLEGETFLLDEHGNRLELVKGDKLVLPQGTLHAEGETTGRMVYIVATPDPRPVEEFLKLRSPEERPA